MKSVFKFYNLCYYKSMKQIEIYTDGACSGNPGVGGWGAVLIYGKIKREISGAEPNTTNNRMEIMAVLKALSLVKEPCEINIYSDSAYVVNAFCEDWISGWQKNNWKNANKKEVKNKELWLMLLQLLKPHKITWIKVKGHADNKLNNRCDFLATTAIKEFKEE